MDPAEIALAFNSTILHCDTLETIQAAFVEAITGFGFDHFACGELDMTQRTRAVIYATNWPLDWRQLYISGAYINRDPMLEVAMTRYQPFWWSFAPGESQIRIPDADALAYWDPKGLPVGICVPLHSHASRMGVISITGQLAEISRDRFDAAVSMAVCLYEVLRRLAPRLGVTIQFAGLSPRELDCLRLIAKGWSDKRVARELEIAPSTAHDYIESLKAKLQVKTRIEAVAIAVSLGLAEG